MTILILVFIARLLFSDGTFYEEITNVQRVKNVKEAAIEVYHLKTRTNEKSNSSYLYEFDLRDNTIKEVSIPEIEFKEESK